ncbi:hypothetical protein UFOVP32_62 [uncultured Caudovirales phage]|uniref:Uncharacterized protein n=1 Tax=uncultured Caudovirales phage TaxID=2100421 RepID=A0A6J5KKH9_9CAUD|nr:hypothetical protein UFOVP32_62 [uncultured Caudovirales phage]CAB4123567.1 hypothetical protein UFOVP50_14 [uncultured Caudovirales phage]
MDVWDDDAAPSKAGLWAKLTMSFSNMWRWCKEQITVKS